MKNTLFIVLYILGIIRNAFRQKATIPDGIKGYKLLYFYDPAYPLKRYGCVMFVIPKDKPVEMFGEIYGPFGMADNTNIPFTHIQLYGRGTWGIPSLDHIILNSQLQGINMVDNYILLAGVLRFQNRFTSPMNRATRFILTFK